MNTSQELEIIEKLEKSSGDLKTEIDTTITDFKSNGYLLSYIHSDEMFIYIIFSKFDFTVPTV